MEYKTLNNGVKMPVVGFGVSSKRDKKKECKKSCFESQLVDMSVILH